MRMMRTVKFPRTVNVKLTASAMAWYGLLLSTTPAASSTADTIFTHVIWSSFLSMQWDRNITRMGDPLISVCTTGIGTSCSATKMRHSRSPPTTTAETRPSQVEAGTLASVSWVTAGLPVAGSKSMGGTDEEGEGEGRMGMLENLPMEYRVVN